MIYAFILLSIVAALTWSVWDGESLPRIESASIREKAVRIYEDTLARVGRTVKNKAKEELRKAIDEKIDSL
jgi:hypothetical protein